MRMGWKTGIAAGAAALVVLGMPGSAAAMSGGTPVTDPQVGRWVATLAIPGDAPLLQRAGCGGALVAPDRVLTAAHCVDRTDPSRTEVHVGARVLSAEPGEVRGVRGIAELPGYRLLPSPAGPDEPGLDSARRDLAVVLLDRPVTDIAPLRIAAHRPVAGAPVQFFAHGTTGIAGPDAFRNDVLHRGDLTVLDRAGCHDATPAAIDDGSVWCAADTTTAAAVTGCYQDSGSPAVQTVAGQPELVGVFSFGGETAGRSCGEPSPLYFADPTAFRTWIHQPLLPTQPYPASRPTVTGSAMGGGVVHCTAPAWDLRRGLPPATIAYQWMTVTVIGPFVIPEPIEGATGRDFTVDTASAGLSLACQVTAGNAGGHSAVLSDPVITTL
ncbi:S1 family peptidase [Winogradskya consettensis]|nr:trypsin-like serine protease [Actinoplanes consettensis]